MTETTTATATKESTDTEDVFNPTRGGEVAHVDPEQAARAKFEQFELAVRRMLGLEDASEGEIELFFHVCQKSGLDPFNKEVYMIGRDTDVGTYEPVDPAEPEGAKRKVMRRVVKYTIQTAINGFRKRARAIADDKAVTYTQGDAMWCGEDGVWKEVWPETKVPTAAKFTVYRDGVPYSFVAHYSEYVQMAGQPAGPNSMWKKMPRNQLRKCAEVGAIQSAFPDELGGLVFDEAAQVGDIIDSDGAIIQHGARRPAQRGRGVDGLMDLADQDATIVEHQPEPTPAEDAPEQPNGDPRALSESARQKWENRMFQLLNKAAEVTDRDDQLIVIAALAGRDELEHRTAITDGELQDVVTALNDRGEQHGDLPAATRELIDKAKADRARAAAEPATTTEGTDTE